jgi:hypothetical protein
MVLPRSVTAGHRACIDQGGARDDQGEPKVLKGEQNRREGNKSIFRLQYKVGSHTYYIVTKYQVRET